MYIKYNISIIALAVSLAVVPGAMAQVLDLDADADIGAKVDADADANVDLGSHTDPDASVDVTIGGGSSAGSDGASGGLSVDGDVDVDLSSGQTAVDADIIVGNTDGGGATVDGNVRLLGLSDQDARLDVFIGLLGDSGLANVDLDAAIDDHSVSIVPLDDVFGASAMAQIQLALSAGADGIEETRAAIAGSSELQAVLASEGISPDAVLALQIGVGGATDAFVDGDARPARASLSASLEAGAGDDGAGGGGGSDGAPAPSGGGGLAPGGRGAVIGGNEGGGGVAAGDDGSVDAGGALAGGGNVVVDVANLGCPAGLSAMVAASNMDPLVLNAITQVSVIVVSGCPAGSVVAAGDVVEIRAAIRQDEDLLRAVQSRGYTVDSVIGAVAEGNTLVLYVVVAEA